MSQSDKAFGKISQSLEEKDLKRWNLLGHFQDALEGVFGKSTLEGSWSDPKRRLAAADYLSLSLFGLFNPVVRTMRGLVEASHLPRVQEEVCQRSVSLGSFSEAQHLLDPILLERVLTSLVRTMPEGGKDWTDGKWDWQARDGSLFRALPRMTWALHGVGAKGAANRAVRLHLSLHVFADTPRTVDIQPGRVCERAIWEQQLEKGAGYIADRYFGENYQLFGRLEKKGCAYVIRLLDQAVINVEEELTVSPEDRAQGVVRQAWVKLGNTPRYHSTRLRVVWVEAKDTILILATNLEAQALSAAEVSLLYRWRWKIELYFRWLKCILGNRHWLAESANGAAIQLYLALIAAVLLQLYTGRKPNKRMMELIQFYLLDYATKEDLIAGLKRFEAQLQKRKKS